MNTKYKEFLKEIDVISEEDFMGIIKTFPEYDNVNFDLFNLNDKDEIASCIINSILVSNWSCVYADNVDFVNKSFDLEDVDSLEDLDEIKDTFKEYWTIANYSEVKKELEEYEEECKEESEKISFIQEISKKYSLSKLKEIFSSHDEK